MDPNIFTLSVLELLFDLKFHQKREREREGRRNAYVRIIYIRARSISSRTKTRDTYIRKRSNDCHVQRGNKVDIIDEQHCQVSKSASSPPISFNERPNYRRNPSPPNSRQRLSKNNVRFPSSDATSNSELAEKEFVRGDASPPLLSPSNRVTKLKPIRFFVRDTSKPIRPSVGWESFPINPRLVVADSLLSEEEVGGMRGACNFIFFIAIFNFSGTCFHYKIFLYLSANFR